MTDYVTAILLLKPPYGEDPATAVDLLAAWSNSVYGEGGLPGDSVFENRLGVANSRVYNSYIRTRIGTAYGVALEYVEAQGGSEIAELVRVEWYGQDMVDTGEVDEDGNAIIERQPFLTGTDANGNPVYLPRFAE
jgi:hypothetical protein